MSKKDEANVKKYNILIFGYNYTILSDEKESDINYCTFIVDSNMKDIAKESNLNDVTKIAILSNLKLANNIKKNEDLNNQINSRINNLISIIDQII